MTTAGWINANPQAERPGAFGLAHVDVRTSGADRGLTSLGRDEDRVSSTFSTAS
jgi:hypothetical protein